MRKQIIIEEEDKDLEAGGTKYCEICYEDHPKSQFFIAQKECRHQFCKNAYKDFFEYQIKQSGQGHTLKCPQ